MKNPFAPKPSPYEPLREQLFEEARNEPAFSDKFGAVLQNLDTLRKIETRSSEREKSLIAASGTVAGVIGIYALQQFAGVIVPKALDMIASRQPTKPH